jgi:hypothetical protein
LRAKEKETRKKTATNFQSEDETFDFSTYNIDDEGEEERESNILFRPPPDEQPLIIVNEENTNESEAEPKTEDNTGIQT